MGASSTSSRLTLSSSVVVAAGDLEALEIDAVSSSARLRHLRVGLLDGLVDGLLQLVVFDDHGFDAEAGLELDLVDGVQVGRIRDREEQALAAAEQRQHAMLREQLVRDQPDDVEIDVDRVEIEQRHAEFGRRGDGDVAGIGGAAVIELRDDARLASLAAFSALSMAASSTTPSWTRRCGRPPRPGALPPSAKEALSFMSLRASDQTR